MLVHPHLSIALRTPDLRQIQHKKPVRNKNFVDLVNWHAWGVNIRPKDAEYGGDDIHHFCDVIQPKDAPKKNNYLDYFNPAAQ